MNAVSPGFIQNNFNKALHKKVGEVIAEMIAYETPLRRLATGHDVACAVLFLVSQDADFVTGQNIIVSGGADI